MDVEQFFLQLVLAILASLQRLLQVLVLLHRSLGPLLVFRGVRDMNIVLCLNFDKLHLNVFVVLFQRVVLHHQPFVLVFQIGDLLHGIFELSLQLCTISWSLLVSLYPNQKRFAEGRTILSSKVLLSSFKLSYASCKLASFLFRSLTSPCRRSFSGRRKSSSADVSSMKSGADSTFDDLLRLNIHVVVHLSNLDIGCGRGRVSAYRNRLEGCRSWFANRQVASSIFAIGSVRLSSRSEASCYLAWRR